MRNSRFFCSILLLASLFINCECENTFVDVSSGILDISKYDTKIHSVLEDPIDLGSKEEEKPQSHKNLLPLNGSDIAGFILAALGLLTAAGGGIGGGGILVPIYTLVLHFTPKHAIPLANVSVFGGACANVLLNLSKRHPDVDRPLVDWNLILMMEPLTIAGALIGATLNKILPDWLIVILLVIVLSVTARRTLRKGKKMYEKENKERESVQENINQVNNKNENATTEVSESGSETQDSDLGMELEVANTLGTPLVKEQVTEKNSLALSMSQLLLEESTTDPRLNEILEAERKTPLPVVLAIFVLFIVVVVFNILKGGGGKSSTIGIECGSVWFWLIQLFMLIWIFIVAFLARIYLMKQTKLKEDVNYTYAPGDIVWDGRATLMYPAICSGAGLCAGMFGVGGGIVKGPLMLAMGVHPLVAAATSATMILFTSLTATTSFIVFGVLQYDYAYVLVVIGFLSTLIGQTVMNMLIKKTGRNSYIVYIIGVVVLLSAILMTLQSFFSVQTARKGESSSTPFCGAGA